MTTYTAIVVEGRRLRRHLVSAPSFWQAHLSAWNIWGKTCVRKIRHTLRPAQKARPA